MAETVKRRRLRWILPTVLIALWMFLGGAGGSYAGKLGEVVKNDASAFLPASADSTKVAKAEKAFVGAEQIPAVVVYYRAAGVTDADRAAVTADLQLFQGYDGVAGQSVGPFVSADGKAIEVVVPMATTGDATVLPGAVSKIRDQAKSHTGLEAHVTGPGGMAADFSEAFAGIDVILLLVALGVVFVILVVVYRSIILPLLVLISAVFAQTLAAVAVYYLAEKDFIQLSGQSQGTLIIICVGAATDYALLLVGRYREELRDVASKYDAMWVALRQTTPTIVASGASVVVAMMCLLLADLSSNRGYAPVFGLGIAAAVLATITFLAPVMILLGRGAFWPVRPKLGSAHTQEHGIWGRTAQMISSRPRRTWLLTAVILVALAAFLPTFKVTAVSTTDSFRGKPDSVVGLGILVQHFPAGSGAPALVLAPVTQQNALVAAIEDVPGVASVTPFSTDPPGPSANPKVVDGKVLLQATLSDSSDSTRAQQTIDRIRDTVGKVSQDALVGGPTAIAVDTARAGWADLKLIVPLVLVVVLALLVLLLRSFVGPLLLVGTVVVSVAATFGIAAIFFNHVFKLPGADPSLPLFCVVFLIALGVDYNIFLMARVREETKRLGDTRAGIVRGLTATGGVITSAGVVLAATFSVLAVVPILPLVQIAFIIAAGILVDTFLVRAVLAPALSYDVGRSLWWPSALRRQSTGDPVPAQRAPDRSPTKA